MHRPTTPGPPNPVADRPRVGVTVVGGFAGEPSVPVFVDGSGRRRKGWRRLTIAVVGALCGYACLLGIGLAGGPIPPSALLPVPGVPNGGPAKTTSTSNNPPADTAAPAVATRPAPSRTSAAGRTGQAAATPTGTAKPSHPPVSRTASTAGGAPSPTALPSTTVGNTSPSSSVSATHGPPATPPGHTHTHSTAQ